MFSEHETSQACCTRPVHPLYQRCSCGEHRSSSTSQNTSAISHSLRSPTAIPTNESNIRWIRRLTRRTYVLSSLCVHFCVLQVSFWQAVKDTTASYDALVDLLESMEGFLNRLDIYAKFPPTPIMAEIIVKIMVELLSTLAVATKQVEQGRPSESILADADARSPPSSLGCS